MPELDEIIKSCQEGKRSAQKALYEIFAPKMFGICLRYAHNREEAEDFLQDGFIRAFQKIGQFKFKGSFEGWLRKLMVNLILESLRKNRHMAELPLEVPPDNIFEEWDGGGSNPEFSLDVLLGVIAQLPEKYRMVFNLYVLEEESHEMIARRLGITEGTSKSNLSRARQWLRHRLNEMAEKENSKM